MRYINSRLLTYLRHISRCAQLALGTDIRGRCRRCVYTCNNSNNDVGHTISISTLTVKYRSVDDPSPSRTTSANQLGDTHHSSDRNEIR